ncbi:MAG: hypothetical protein J2P41_09995 [Blastocatellia bacterium]|nr:hypothetical protein [Blastocatellia bacterium]
MLTTQIAEIDLARWDLQLRISTYEDAGWEIAWQESETDAQSKRPIKFKRLLPRQPAQAVPHLRKARLVLLICGISSLNL